MLGEVFFHFIALVSNLQIGVINSSHCFSARRTHLGVAFSANLFSNRSSLCFFALNFRVAFAHRKKNILKQATYPHYLVMSNTCFTFAQESKKI